MARAQLISKDGTVVDEFDLPKHYNIPYVIVDGEKDIIYMMGNTGNGIWEYNTVTYFVKGSKSKALFNQEGNLITAEINNDI